MFVIVVDYGSLNLLQIMIPITGFLQALGIPEVLENFMNLDLTP